MHEAHHLLLSRVFLRIVLTIGAGAYCVPHEARSQPFVWELKPSFTVVRPSLPDVSNPFSGGINIPIVQFVDIDADGDQDLYLLDSDGRLSYWENIGDESAPNFLMRNLDVLDADGARIVAGTWFRFVDIDRDGDFDVFCNQPSSFVKYYKNVGSPQLPSFVLETDTLSGDDGNPLLSDFSSIPAFADADGDGDMDFFSGNLNGSIWHYENIDTTGQSFQFRLVTDQYQNIEIIGLRRVPSPGESFEVQKKSALHGAMALDFADIDADGDLDMFWGDFFNTSLYHLENTGSPIQPQFVLRDSTFPKPNAVQSNGFNMPQFVDIDSDGRLDMFIGILSGIPVDNFLYYKNVGSNQSAVFELQTSNFLTTVDHGAASSPMFADIDGDGDLDLIIGTEDGKLVQYDRVGDGAGLQFVLSQNPRFTTTGFFNTSPAFGDIDGDGAVDMILGEANGRIHLYRGTNPSAEDMTFTLRDSVFGQNAAPVLVDYDGDGDLDLFVGTGGGRMHYYQNEGTHENFIFVRISNFFESIDVGDDAKPLFIDMDNDSDLDLVIGSRDSSLFYYRNDGGIFNRVEGFFSGVATFPRVAPAVHDIDNDGDYDLFLGNFKGGLLYYRNDNIVTSVEASQVPTAFELKQNYPNPFNPTTVIGFQLPATSWVRLSVYNMLGQEVASLLNNEIPAGVHAVRWDAVNIPSGVYFYRLQAGKYVETRKAVLLK